MKGISEEGRGQITPHIDPPAAIGGVEKSTVEYSHVIAIDSNHTLIITSYTYQKCVCGSGADRKKVGQISSHNSANGAAT